MSFDVVLYLPAGKNKGTFKSMAACIAAVSSTTPSPTTPSVLTFTGSDNNRFVSVLNDAISLSSVSALFSRSTTLC